MRNVEGFGVNVMECLSCSYLGCLTILTACRDVFDCEIVFQVCYESAFLFSLVVDCVWVEILH